MKVTLYMVMSLDGYIASEDGSEEWISDDNWIETLRVAHEFGNIIFGRTTYERLLDWGDQYTQSLDDVEKVIVSKKTVFQSNENFVSVQSPVTAVDYLQKSGFQRALVSGGSVNNTSFMQAHLIDDILISIVPCILGKGIPLFQREGFAATLKLTETRNVTK